MNFLIKIGVALLTLWANITGAAKADADKQAGRDAEKVDEAARLNKEVIDAKSEDTAASNSAPGSSAQWLRDNFSRPD